MGGPDAASGSARSEVDAPPPSISCSASSTPRTGSLPVTTTPAGRARACRPSSSGSSSPPRRPRPATWSSRLVSSRRHSSATPSRTPATCPGSCSATCGSGPGARTSLIHAIALPRGLSASTMASSCAASSSCAAARASPRPPRRARPIAILPAGDALAGRRGPTRALDLKPTTGAQRERSARRQSPRQAAAHTMGEPGTDRREIHRLGKGATGILCEDSRERAHALPVDRGEAGKPDGKWTLRRSPGYADPTRSP